MRILDLAGHDSPITSIDISPIGNIAASADKSGALVLWDMVSGGKLARQAMGKGEITTVKFLDKGGAIACGLNDGCIDLNNVRALAVVGHARRPASVGQEEMADMWPKLASESPEVAWEAAAWWAAGASDERISYLASRVQSYRPSHDISGAIEALEADSADAREKAVKTLIDLDIEAESRLKHVAVGGKSRESQDRARYILGQSAYPIMRSAEARQVARAITVIKEAGGSDWENALDGLRMSAQSVLVRRIVTDIISALK
jgi:hypothetical protein